MVTKISIKNKFAKLWNNSEPKEMVGILAKDNDMAKAFLEHPWKLVNEQREKALTTLHSKVNPNGGTLAEKLAQNNETAYLLMQHFPELLEQSKEIHKYVSYSLVNSIFNFGIWARTNKNNLSAKDYVAALKIVKQLKEFQNKPAAREKDKRRE